MSTVTRSVSHWLCRVPRWGFPVFALVLGLVLAGAMALGGQTGWWGVVLAFLVYGVLLFVLSPHSEVAALMAGDARDERQRSINEKASTATFAVLVVVLVGGFVVTTAVGSDLAVVFSGLSGSPGSPG